jgi:hypothetical protein
MTSLRSGVKMDLMKKQNSAKGFKIIYFIISALWMAWWGGFVLFAIAGPMEDKIIAFFAALLPIPIYYIIKGFFIGSKKIMNQPKYILIIVVLGIIAFVGWNKIGTSVKDKELVVECYDPQDSKKEYLTVKISNGKMCLLSNSPEKTPMCAELSIFNSDIVRTITLNPSTSALARFFEEEPGISYLELELDRNTGILEFHFVLKNKNMDSGGFFYKCRKKEKL